MSIDVRPPTGRRGLVSRQPWRTAQRINFALAALAIFVFVTGASVAEPLKLYTNQAYLEEAQDARVLPLDDKKAMFKLVLDSLPPRVKVYPTENYFYFKFLHNNVPWAGNIRLDVLERDKGKVNFAYFEDLAEWKSEDQVRHKLFDSTDGVVVEKVAALLYRVSIAGSTVDFELNDLSAVKPPPGLMVDDERYIGPVHDESGMRFFLLYNSRLKIFHYILDETAQRTDQLLPLPSTDRIVIGKRTGFAYYRDQKHGVGKPERKILIGVFEGNARVNNYFDGPFDQLPDNFIEGEQLRSAILEVEPQLKGRIDRFGISPGGADRYMIAPYRFYRTEEDLLVFHECAESKEVPVKNFGACFVFQETPPPDTVTEAPPAAARQNRANIKAARPAAR